jgi:hypothetical protein
MSSFIFIIHNRDQFAICEQILTSEEFLCISDMAPKSGHSKKAVSKKPNAKYASKVVGELLDKLIQEKIKTVQRNPKTVSFHDS